MKKIGIIESCMRYRRIMLLVVGLLVLLGIYGLAVMPKQEFPPFTIRQGLIVGVYPGATSEEVEEQLAKPLERFMFTYKEVKKAKTYTMSQDGIVYMMVELNDDVHNKDEVWSKIKHGVADFKMQLPSGVLALVVNDDFGDTSALLVSLQSEDKTYRELQNYLDDLEGRLRRIESVSNLRRYGLQNEQITVYFDPDKLAVYGLDQRLLMARLFAQGFTTTGGSVENSGQELPIHFTPSYDSEYEIAEQIVYSDPHGNVIRLKDIARIVREYDDPDSYVTNNGRKAVILSMEMREGNNIVEYGKEVDEVLAEFQKTLPEDVQIERIADQPKVVDESVTSFVRDLLVSIVVVIAVMMVLFPFRSAIVAATSIPISIFISIGIMFITGIPLNTVTLAALIVVLGMIVDNSIIVVDAYLENLDRGMSRWYAAVSSAKNYFGSIFLATLCICIIFFPLLVTMSGQFLDFLKDFPWTITISLMTSLVLAMIFIPFLEYVLIKKGLHQRKSEQEGKKRHGNMLEVVQRWYGHALDWTFRWPKLTIFGGIMTVVVAGFIMMGLKVRMMPFADRDQLAVEIYLPQGTALERTEAVADSVYQALRADERVKSVTQFIGTASPRFQATYAPNLPSKHYAQFIVNTQSVEATRGLLDDYANAWADRFPGAYVKFKQLDYQNLTTPIEVRFRGDDIDALRRAADTLMAGMRRMGELVWVHTNYEEPLAGIRVQLDPVESARLGINRMTAQTELAACYSGFPAGTLWEGDYPLSVVLKAQGTEGDDPLDRIGDQYIATAIPGVSVPLRQVATVDPAWHEGQIVRRNGVRTLSVMADVRRGYNEGEAFKQVQRLVEAQTLPDGVEFEYGGSIESDAEINGPIIKGVSAAAFIIFLFLLINFKKVSLSIVALISISLCLLGAALGLWMTGTEFGLTCVLGLISLMGIIVRNAIIMFQHAEDLRIKKRVPAREAAYDAGKRRMLPIFLTSATTAVGVVPMIISQSSLWTPMGIVICVGTVVSMILVVTVLPVTYWKIFGNVKLKNNPYEA
ncbi:efflux RND transporter permease subunit [Millionella massiliensis]|uniref:efflux RND transporter permease subunit n=1 Tax=Millionella massiliensis TaxID=1871023 RepID=UPI0024B68A3E|nr:efflux RND transporter permease subunit [Millionella massiliensis]